MTYLGDINPADILDCKFTTTAAATGAPTTLAGTPVVSVYKDNSITQSASGVTLTTDFDGVAGLNHVRVDTSADGTFYAAGNFQVVITTGTVGGTSAVGYVVAQFSIQRRSALRPTVAGRSLDVTVTGAAGVDWSNVENPTTTVGLSGTTVKTATDVAAKTNNLPAAPAAVSDIPAANVNANALLDLTDGVEASFTVRQALRILLAAVGGQATIVGNEVTIRNATNTANRIVATTDTSGQRSVVTLTP